MNIKVADDGFGAAIRKLAREQDWSEAQAVVFLFEFSLERLKYVEDDEFEAYNEANPTEWGVTVS